VQLDTLAGLERVAVRTRNSTYEITVLSPRTGDVLVRGGQFFPVHTRARLAGCSHGRTIITTRVQSVVPIRDSLPAH